MVRKTLLVLAVAGALSPAAASQLITLSQTNLDIAEAAFRHLFGDTTKPGPARCIALLGPDGSHQSSDPTPEFLARFADIPPPVKGPSGCGKAADGIGVADKETGKFAVYYSVGFPKCASETECDVEASYFAAPTAAAAWTYHMKKRDGKWVVTGEEMKWIS
ncbi:MAG TPA: hypothetical protein VMU22_12020 [Rhizomicrobium sp.]|nr:hypothetical protein [Rhizomicrobium sp.]